MELYERDDPNSSYVSPGALCSAPQTQLHVPCFWLPAPASAVDAAGHVPPTWTVVFSAHPVRLVGPAGQRLAFSSVP